MPDPSDLYPKAPQNSTPSVLSDPLKAIGALGQLNQIQLFQQTNQARQAVGRAYQQAIRPDGSIDTPTLMREIGRDPNAAFMAPEAAQGALARQGQQLQNTGLGIGNTTALFNQKVAQSQFVAGRLASLADKDNVTDEDLHHFVVQTARNTNIPSNILNGWMSSVPSDPKARKAFIANLATSVMSPEAAASPAVTGYEPSGAPVGGTAGQASIIRRTGEPRVPGIASPPPGRIEAATGMAGEGARQANSLTAANDSSMVRKGMLGNLEEDLNHFTSGPGADWTKLGKAWINRNVPMPAGWQFDPKSIASQEAFNKQAEQLAQQQFSTIGGTGTDAKFSSAFASNPNDTLSQLGNKGIIRMLKGNEDAIQAKSRAWQQWRRTHGAETYQDFSADFNDKFDPRAFQFKYMSPKERQAYIDRMDPVDRDRFVASLTHAHDQGWIGFDKAK